MGINFKYPIVLAAIFCDYCLKKHEGCKLASS